jgi:hypothetical protein
VRDLGPHDALVMRNHGLLTCGATIQQAFNTMYQLDRAARRSTRWQRAPNWQCRAQTYSLTRRIYTSRARGGHSVKGNTTSKWPELVDGLVVFQRLTVPQPVDETGGVGKEVMEHFTLLSILPTFKIEMEPFSSWRPCSECFPFFKSRSATVAIRGQNSPPRWPQFARI